MTTELLSLLLDAEVFKEDEHREALDKHPKLSEILAILSMGYGNQDDVFKIAKNKLKIPTVNENAFVKVDTKLIDMVPVDLVEKYAILPFFYDGHYLKVSMSDPTDDKAIGEISFFTDTMVIPYMAMPSILSKYINKYYNLSLPEDFKFGINQHLKETFSKEKMLSTELEAKGDHLPSTPNSMSNTPLPTQKKSSPKPPLPGKFNDKKPNIPNSNIVNLPKNEIIENRSLNINNILTVSNKDELFDAVSKELIKITNMGILFFVRANFLQIVSSSIPLDDEITISLEESSVFRDTLETQDVYTGPPYMNTTMKIFLAKLDSKIPEQITLVPIIYKDMVFSILYSENTDTLAELMQIRDAIAKVFTVLVEDSV